MLTPTSSWIFIPGKINGQPAIAYLRREAHIVDHLRAKMLIGMNIIGSEGIILNPVDRTLTVTRCRNLTAPVQITPNEPPVQRKVTVKEDRVLPANALINVAVDYRGTLPERDLMFYPYVLPEGLAAHAHLVDASFYFVQVRNDTDRSIKLPATTHLGTVADCQEEFCYRAHPDMHVLAAHGLAHDLDTDPTMEKLQAGRETKLSNGITVYGAPEIVRRLKAIAEKYPKLWVDHGNIVKVAPE